MTRKSLINILVGAGYSASTAERIAIDYENGDQMARAAVRIIADSERHELDVVAVRVIKI